MSIEVDLLPIADSDAETARLSDLIEGIAGEFSPFEQLHGFSIDVARARSDRKCRRGPAQRFRWSGPLFGLVPPTGFEPALPP